MPAARQRILIRAKQTLVKLGMHSYIGITQQRARCSSMSPSIAQGVVGAQAALLALSLIIGFTPVGRLASKVATALSAVSALFLLVLVGGAAAGGGAVNGTINDYLPLAVISIAAAILTALSMRVAAGQDRARAERRLQSPEARTRAGEELRELMRREGMELDGRLRAAQEEREQFLYALEERHARQIATLAQEYQHEAHTILAQLLDQLVADRLQPMVEQRLAAHQAEIENKLGVLDTDAAGETLNTLTSSLDELIGRVGEAEQRIAKARAENPDRKIEDAVAARLAAIEAQISDRSGALETQLEQMLATSLDTVRIRIDEVAADLDARVDAAADPLTARMNETRAAVETQLNTWDAALEGRFAEVEQRVNARVLEHESLLEQTIGQSEMRIEGRLAEHATAIEQVLAEHDSELQSALAQQSEAAGAHFTAERDRVVTEVTGQVDALRDALMADVTSAGDEARMVIEQTQHAWNDFAGELEERFAQTREEALAAAAEIAEAQRAELEGRLTAMTTSASSDMAERVEAMGREAAWQRARVERAVYESIEEFKGTANAALTDADSLFAELERIGNERVDTIRRQAEDALVQSRDYVEQLQESLTSHLEGLRTRSADVADEMNQRLTEVTMAAHDAAQQLDQHARDLVEAAARELATAADHQVAVLHDRLERDLAASLEANLRDQQRQFESYLGEGAQRMLQQVQGDLAGLTEHARTAVTSELEQMIVQAQEHARQVQEQGFLDVMNDLARQQGDLARRAREAVDTSRTMLDESLRDNRRQLEESMASMGAHLREELVRFQDEGQRRVNEIIARLRAGEQDLLREEDRRLAQARSALVRQHQGALEDQVRSMVGGLTNTMVGSLGSAPLTASPASGSFTTGVDRPATPLGATTPGSHSQQPYGTV